MTDFDKQCVHELSREYIFRTFDFTSGSPTDLLQAYRDVYAEISNVFDEEAAKIAKKYIEDLSRF